MYLRSQNFVFVKHVLVVGECCIFIDNDQQGNACPHFTGAFLIEQAYLLKLRIKRQQHRGTTHTISSEALLYRPVLLKGIEAYCL